MERRQGCVCSGRPCEDPARRQHVQARREASGETRPPTPRPWTFSLQNWEETLLCCFSPPSAVLCCGSLSKLTHGVLFSLWEQEHEWGGAFRRPRLFPTRGICRVRGTNPREAAETGPVSPSQARHPGAPLGLPQAGAATFTPSSQGGEAAQTLPGTDVCFRGSDPVERTPLARTHRRRAQARPWRWASASETCTEKKKQDSQVPLSTPSRESAQRWDRVPPPLADSRPALCPLGSTSQGHPGEGAARQLREWPPIITSGAQA